MTFLTSLGANYPNPFSTLTTIPFNINIRSYITLEVLDELGRIVATLANDSYEIGNYETKFNADNLPGASYFIRLRSGKETFIRSILLTK
jgi:hypothetical protein